MERHASALKAHRQAIKRQEQNRQARARLRRRLRGIRAALSTRPAAELDRELRATFSLIDRMASKGIIHRNAAARYKSRLHTQARKSS